MTNPKMIADRYLAAWNEPSGSARRQRIADEWSPEARYLDPLMAGNGREEIAAMIEAARGQFPGHGFTLAGQPDGHGAFVRFAWTLAPENGAPVGGGTDIVRLDPQGRIAEVIGFLDGAAAHA